MERRRNSEAEEGGRREGGDEGKIGMLAVKVVKVKMNMEVVFEVCILR